MGARAIHAEAMIVGDGAPLRDGALVLGDDGVVIDVGPAGEVLPRHAGAPIERVLGVIFPGLVNAHTHLELSGLRGQVPGGAGFVPWVERLIGARSEAHAEDDAEAVERAVADLVASGTAAVGEVTNSLAAVGALARAGIGGRVFHEVFGVSREGVMARVAALATELTERIGAWPTHDLGYAPTPHTVYTTHPDAIRAVLEAARARGDGARMSLHLAEHPAERRALERGDGPVTDWYAARLKIAHADQVWPRVSPVAYADALGAIAPDVLIVHLTDARPEELAVVAARGAPVALCPRSNLHIETKLPPLLAMRAAGIEAALGTDSLASNASLDVLAEARALADRFSAVPARDLVQMATWNGARALGRPDLGRFARGARPGVVAVDGALGADADHPAGDPAAFLLKHVRAPRRWIARRHPELSS